MGNRITHTRDTMRERVDADLDLATVFANVEADCVAIGPITVENLMSFLTQLPESCGSNVNPIPLDDAVNPEKIKEAVSQHESLVKARTSKDAAASRATGTKQKEVDSNKELKDFKSMASKQMKEMKDPMALMDNQQ